MGVVETGCCCDFARDFDFCSACNADYDSANVCAVLFASSGFYAPALSNYKVNGFRPQAIRSPWICLIDDLVADGIIQLLGNEQSPCAPLELLGGHTHLLRRGVATHALQDGILDLAGLRS